MYIQSVRSSLLVCAIQVSSKTSTVKRVTVRVSRFLCVFLINTFFVSQARGGTEEQYKFLIIMRKNFCLLSAFALMPLLVLFSCSDDDNGNDKSNDAAVVEGYCPNSKHPHAVDLGLSVKWACCNVGSSSPEQFMNYYAWGETQTKESYTEENHLVHLDDFVNEDNYKDFEDTGIDIAGTKYDVAHVKWGKGWKIPSESQMEELSDRCNQEYVELNGVKGVKFTGPTGKSIFLPSVGFFDEDGRDDADEGFYWSSTAYYSFSHDELLSVYLNSYIDKNGRIHSYTDENYPNPEHGLCVRPVTE